MASRPIFVPRRKGSQLVEEIIVPFVWNPGMAASQKRKNVLALHDAARQLGFSPLLEISSKSEDETGRRLSAFTLTFSVGGHPSTVETIYQGSKVFQNGGPYTDLYFATSREARSDRRLRESGQLVQFQYEDRDYPLTPGTAFYDWIYLNAMYRDTEWYDRLKVYAGFTDIEFNPAKSLNCQARSCATFISLHDRELLDDAVESFDTFASYLENCSI